MKQCLESALLTRREWRRKCYCFSELLHWLCVLVHRVGGVVRNALITLLCCPALASHIAFCLHLESTTKKLARFQPFSSFCTSCGRRWIQEWDMFFVWVFQEERIAPFFPIVWCFLLLLWWECCDTFSNPGRAVPKRMKAHIHFALLSLSF